MGSGERETLGRRVPALLRTDTPHVIAPALNARVSVQPTDAGAVEVAIDLEGGTTWLLHVEPAAAAYLAGGLAHHSGVRIG